MIYVLQLGADGNAVCWTATSNADLIAAAWQTNPDAPQFQHGKPVTCQAAIRVLATRFKDTLVFFGGAYAREFLKGNIAGRADVPAAACALLWRRLEQHRENMAGVPLPVTVKIGPRT